jgi:ubiquinone/menaquinone biosynthesis C-methylase UbiE
MPEQFDPKGNEIRHLRQFAQLSGANVLEIGCGDGRLTWKYAAEPCQITGLDPDPARLAKAQQARPPGLRARLAFIQAHAEAIPLPHETFDLAILAWSL